MIQVIANKPHQLNRLHEGLSQLGGTPADYRVEGGGYDPATSQARPTFVQVSTELPAITEANLSAFIAAHNSLRVAADKAMLIADGVDSATITCNDARIVSDGSLDYSVWLDGELYAAKTSAPIVGGIVTLTLITEEPGEYLIEFQRRGVGDYESGYMTIMAVEVA